MTEAELLLVLIIAILVALSVVLWFRMRALRDQSLRERFRSKALDGQLAKTQTKRVAESRALSEAQQAVQIAKKELQSLQDQLASNKHVPHVAPGANDDEHDISSSKHLENPYESIQQEAPRKELGSRFQSDLTAGAEPFPELPKGGPSSVDKILAENPREDGTPISAENVIENSQATKDAMPPPASTGAQVELFLNEEKPRPPEVSNRFLHNFGKTIPDSSAESLSQPTLFGNEILPADTVPANIAPENRGGRPRTTAPSSQDNPLKDDSKKSPRIDIVCSKRDWQWLIGVELPEELRSAKSLHVRQGTKELNKSDSIIPIWLLNDSGESVVVEWTNGEGLRKIVQSLDLRRLVFKLGDDQNKGRLVKRLSSGSYAVFVPEDWERDENISGPVSVEPEHALWLGYLVHFFEFQTEDTPAIAFRTKDGLSHAISEKLQISLVGNMIPDVSEHVGPLFGNPFPALVGATVRSVIQVKTIVVGEEGHSQGNWRLSFPWDEGSLCQALPDQLAKRGAKWYFVRLYDDEDELIGSLDFRFVPGLQSIEVDKVPPSEINGGKRIIAIKFLHNQECTVFAGDDLASTAVIERMNHKTIATLQADPSTENISWRIGHESIDGIYVRIDLSVLSWSLGDESVPPNRWGAQPLFLPRELFKPTSSQCIWLRFPRTVDSKRSLVGFSRSKGLYYPISAKERVTKIPLRDFEHTEDVVKTEASDLKVWIDAIGNINNNETTPRIVASIPRLITIYHCTIDSCTFFTDDFSEFYQHVGVQHDKHRYIELVNDYNEFLTHYKDIVGSDWPQKIYRCNHCDKYVRWDGNFGLAGDVIYRHLLDEHPGKDHAFRIVSSVDEIRQEVITGLPKLCRCKHCDKYVEDKDVNDFWHHLLTIHRDDFVRIEVREDLTKIS